MGMYMARLCGRQVKSERTSSNGSEMRDRVSYLGLIFLDFSQVISANVVIIKGRQGTQGGGHGCSMGAVPVGSHIRSFSDVFEILHEHSRSQPFVVVKLHPFEQVGFHSERL